MRDAVQHGIDKSDITAAHVRDGSIFADHRAGRQMRHCHQFTRTGAQHRPIQNRQPVHRPAIGKAITKRGVKLFTLRLDGRRKRVQMRIVDVLHTEGFSDVITVMRQKFWQEFSNRLSRHLSLIGKLDRRQARRRAPAYRHRLQLLASISHWHQARP